MKTAIHYMIKNKLKKVLFTDITYQTEKRHSKQLLETDHTATKEADT